MKSTMDKLKQKVIMKRTLVLPLAASNSYLGNKGPDIADMWSSLVIINTTLIIMRGNKVESWSLVQAVADLRIRNRDRVPAFYRIDRLIMPYVHSMPLLMWHSLHL
nr:hypothetical protein [Tanacetum cinerariifolium]